MAGVPLPEASVRERAVSDLAIQVTGLTKVFKVWKRPSDMLAETLTGRKRHAEFRALSNVSFDMPKGAVLGVLGRNGAGKSTLLRLVAGTLEKTSGKVKVNGRIAAILELGTGFHPDYTGRENVVLGGLCLGLTKKEINRRFDEIVEFSELREFIDQPFRTYSSGMQARLTFAVATSVDPDILIIDEALSVGDARFSLKSFDRIQDFKKRGKAILFVSHDINMVNTFCDQAIMLERGELYGSGPAKVVGNAYHQLLFGSGRQLGWTPAASDEDKGEAGAASLSPGDDEVMGATDAAAMLEEDEDPNDGTTSASIIPFTSAHDAEPEAQTEPAQDIPDEPAKIVSFAVRDERGEVVTRLQNLANYEFVLEVTSPVDVRNVACGFTVRGPRGIELFSSDTVQQKQPVLAKLAAGETAKVIAAFRNVLAPGTYFVTPFIGRSDGVKHDERPDCVELSVEESPGVYTASLVNLEMDFKFSRRLAKVS
jgi:lipopolysaccharide transport system ATP-binding protein